MSKPSSKLAGTAVLTIALLSLQGALWYFRPQPAGKVPLLYRYSAVNSHGGNRKLLAVNFSMNSDQKLSSGNIRHLGTTNDQQHECSALHHLNSSGQRCHFVKSTESCQMDEGFIQYVQFPYCSFPTNLVPLAFFLLFLWLAFLFITLGLTADDYFCSSLHVISKTLRISQNIAGVTFLAFGNGAPDIFSAIAAFSQSRNQNGVQLGIQALFGAGMFVTTVVVSAISFVSTITLTTRPFTRDVLFSLGAVSLTFITLYEENITLGESIGFIVLYVAYVLVVIFGHYIYQRWKRNSGRVEIKAESPESESNGDFLESGGRAGTRGSNESVNAVTVNAETNDINRENTIAHHSHHTLSDALIASENTLLAAAIHSAPIPAREEFTCSDEDLPLLGGKRKVRAWRKFLQGLEPIDREDWCNSNFFWKFFMIVKAPAVFCLNLTVPVVDYGKENHNWNKWLNVLHCITMPVFGVMATQAGERFPAWALALLICGGIALAVIVAMTTRSDKQPCGHFLFAYVAFVVSVIWIYATANEIVNLLQTFGIAFGLSDAILGLTFLAWGNSIGDLVSSIAMARQGFSRMAVSACIGFPLLNMLLGIGISCTVATVSRGHAIPLRHRYHQYQISAGFLAASLSSSAILIPLMGFKVPRMYGVYLIVLYVAYLAVSIACEFKHI
ncbi:hypothetical protein ACROYT_G009241 [Oculina patagonica]